MVATTLVPYLQGFDSIANAWFKSNDIEAMGTAKAAAHNYNASVNREYARLSILTAESNAIQSGTLGNIRMGRLASSLIASGAVIGEGTPAQQLDQLALQNALDTQKELYRGQMQSLALQRQATQDEYAAQVEEYRTDLASRQTLLTGFQRGVSQIFNPPAGY